MHFIVTSVILRILTFCVQNLQSFCSNYPEMDFRRNLVEIDKSKQVWFYKTLIAIYVYFIAIYLTFRFLKSQIVANLNIAILIILKYGRNSIKSAIDRIRQRFNGHIPL